MNIYQSKYSTLWGTTYKEVIKSAHREHESIKRRNPRRQPYVRSQYFAKDKVFLKLFWDHLSQKRQSDRSRRARLYRCGLDLIRHTSCEPVTITERTQPHILLHKFAGKTADGALFYVQIKENRKTDRKDLISIFPGN